jgi:ABC-2 type transport system ATP-binding protein
MSNDSRIQLEGIDKVFYTHHFFARPPGETRRKIFDRRKVHAVDAVDFVVKPGEIFGLLGPNGAGKTTTVKMISGLVRPSKGTVVVEGMDVNRKRLQVLKKVGVVLEGTRTCIWPLTPMENLAYFGNLKAVRGSVLKKRARELLHFIGLEEKADIQVRRLSRGQKQKLAICIALIADPSVLLLDEPTTGLDVQSSRGIKDKLREMAREQGKSVLVTTHDMHVAQELCDRIGIIDKGKLVTCKPTDELLSLFSEQTYEFRLDRLPEDGLLANVPGVMAMETVNGDDGPTCVIDIDPNPEARSQALYAIIELLKQGGYTLRGIHQRQTTLESVFLRMTTSTI